jgi:potassium/hydrogen antiporter
MDSSILQVMLATGVLLLISVFASKTSSRYGIPVLLIFIVVGMLSGSEGPGGIQFDSPVLTQIIGTISLIFILFSGGLSTHLNSVEAIWKEGLSLSFIGVLISTSVMAVIIRYSLGWNWASAALLSATFSSTDASAVFGILKTQKLQLKSKIQSVIELESGSNDPMAVFLTLTLIQLTLAPQEFSVSVLFINFFIQMSLGGLAGWFMGKGLVLLINWLDLEFEGLYPVLTIAGVICIYSLTEFCGGNGFLSVYIAGLAMGGGRYFSKKTLTVFHDGLAWLMQVAMFLCLGLLVNPRELTPYIGEGVMLAIGLLLIARPISVWLSLFSFKYTFKEILFISWGGLRGAVPIILAIYLFVSGVQGSKIMFNLVFFIVIFSMLIQGTTLRLLARLLNVQEPLRLSKLLPFKSRSEHRDFVEFEVGMGSPLLGKTILELNFPMQFLVVLIHRQEDDFMPHGNTELELYDRLVCLVDTKSIPELERIIQCKKNGSNGRS